MLTWADYCAWRRTKCPDPDPRVLPGIPLAPGVSDSLGPFIRTEEQVHATLEFLGEVSELGTLLLTRDFGGPDEESRDRIIDEIGDVFFCGAWVIDAHGSNVLEDRERLDLIDPEDRDFFSGPGACDQMKLELFKTFLATGLLANNMKKRRYHSVDIDPFDDIYRVIDVFISLDALLSRMGSSVEEALRRNQAKLDRRFPGGWVAGGGNR